MFKSHVVTSVDRTSFNFLFEDFLSMGLAEIKVIVEPQS